MIRHDGADHDQPGRHQLGRVAVEPDELAEPDRAARACHVVDLGAADELAQRLLHGARRLVPAAAGRGRRHDSQLLVAERAFGGRTCGAFAGSGHHDRHGGEDRDKCR